MISQVKVGAFRVPNIATISGKMLTYSYSSQGRPQENILSLYVAMLALGTKRTKSDSVIIGFGCQKLY